MDMNLDYRITNNGLPTTPEGAQEAPVSAQGVSTPVLNGNGLCLTSATDLQRLVDLLKMDQEETQRKLVSQQFSSILLRLVAENGQIDAAQKAAVEAVGKASDELNARKAELSESAKSYEASKKAYETDLGTLEARLAELEAKKSELAGQKSALAELDREIAVLTGQRDAKQLAYDAAVQALAALNDTRDATVVLMEIAIAELDRLIESQKTTPEEREQERVRQERQAEQSEKDRAVAEKIAKLKEQISGYQAAIAALDADIAVQKGSADSLGEALSQLNAAIEGKATLRQEINSSIGALDASVASLELETAGLRAKVASEATACEERAKALQAAEAAWTAAGQALNAALAALDKIGISTLAEAIVLTATQVKQATAEMPDEEKAAAKAEEILKLTEAVLKAIEEKNDEELEKLVAKLPDALGDLLGSPRTLNPTDLPDYELRA